MKNLKSFLNIDFLVKDNSSKNWKMILFISMLAVIMISSGHSADKKIFKISSLNTSIKSLKSDFIQVKQELLILKKESSVAKNYYLEALYQHPYHQSKLLYRMNNKQNFFKTINVEVLLFCIITHIFLFSINRKVSLYSILSK